MSDKKYTPPEKTAKDHGHALARAGLGSIPVIGNAAVELFQALITPPLEERKQKWMEDISEALTSLEAAGKCQLDGLAQNPVFIDTVMHASQVAIRNHQQEKRDALRNAIVNSALPNPLDEALQQMFVNFIDEMTVWHIRILDFFSDPVGWFKGQSKEVPKYTMSSSLTQILTAAYPDLANQKDFYMQVGKDLYRRGLLNTESFGGMMSATGAYERRATALGVQFLTFIKEPA